jgi:hypothetical protein
MYVWMATPPLQSRALLARPGAECATNRHTINRGRIRPHFIAAGFLPDAQPETGQMIAAAWMARSRCACG